MSPDCIYILQRNAIRRAWLCHSKSSYRLSVRDVQVCFSHRLEYFENNFTASARSDSNMVDLVQRELINIDPYCQWQYKPFPDIRRRFLQECLQIGMRSLQYLRKSQKYRRY